jgi:hypothetical protein
MTQAPPRTPTAKELTAARRAQAPAATTPTAAPATPQVPAVRDREQEAREYRARYLDLCAPGVVGRLVKFKYGAYTTADDGAELPADAEYILLADQSLCGWIRFSGTGEAPDRVMGLIYDGFVVPERESLGDLDKTTWEMGLDNEPADPWLHQMCVVLQSSTTCELYTFSTTSRTGRRAVASALKHYDRMSRSHPDTYPVVRLGKGGFKHKDVRVGWVDTPVFVVVGRAPRDSAAKPDTSISALLNDEVPHL